MIIAHTRSELAAALARPIRSPDLPSGAQSEGTAGRPPGREQKLGAPLVLVPTMGALHDGHRALLRRARELAGPGGAVAVSIFVNPLQFGPNEDLDRYPRTLEDDLACCEAEGADLVFAPGVSEMYPQEQLVTVDPGAAGDTFEGEFRPGFFRGVLTVVVKLFSLVRPDIAVFGQKDAQQLVLVRRMSADFGLGIKVEAVPTVRAADGLALSSRNKYLSEQERMAAPALYRSLSAGAAAAGGGPRAVLDAAGRVLANEGALFAVDYLALADARSYAVIARRGNPPYPPAARPMANPAIVSGAQPDPSGGHPQTPEARPMANPAIVSGAQPDPSGGHPQTPEARPMAKSAIGSDVRVSQPDFTGQAVLAIAARIGSTRLIDNVVIEFGTEQHAAGD